ncbi:MAG: hypothetical protein R3D98_10605 [Candidatus Krumholzibacteriia bacterium]
MKTAIAVCLVMIVAQGAGAVDCVRGNPGLPQAYSPDRLGGDVRVAMLLTPEGINCCDDAFLPEEGMFHLRADAMEWASPGIWFAIHEAVWDNGAQELVPGAERCRTVDGWVVNIDFAGEYQITIPPYPGYPGFEACEPFASDQPWFLVFHADFHDADARFDLGTAGPVIDGAYFLRQDEGPWQDLADLGWQGGPAMNVGVACATQPVVTEAHSWSELKALCR